MKRNILGQVLSALGAAAVALFLVELVVLAARWAGSAAGPAATDPLIALYLIFGPPAPSGHVTALAAGGLSFLLSLVWSLRGAEMGRLRRSLHAAILGLVVASGVIAGTAGSWFVLTPAWPDQMSQTRSWMADVTPPTVDVLAPSQAVRGLAPISARVSDENDGRLIGLSIDGFAVTPALQVTLDTSALPDGPHTVIAEAEDLSRRHNRAQATAIFSTETQWWMNDKTAPLITITVPITVVLATGTVSITTSDQGEHHITAITLDNVSLPITNQFTIDSTGLADGQHTLLVDAQDASRQQNHAQAKVTFRTDSQWWLNDKTAPLITITVPITVVQGTAAIRIATSDQGEHHITAIKLDDSAVPITNQLSIDTTHLADGEHTLLVDAEDASRQRNHAQAKAVFRSDNNPPTVTVRLDPPIGAQGHTQLVYLTTSEPLRTMTATLGSRPLALDLSGSYYWAVIGYDAAAEPGSRMLAARAVDVLGNVAAVTATVPVTRFDFPIENTTGEDISLPPEIAQLLDYGTIETAQLDAVYAPVTPDQMWQGMFSVPVQGRQTSAFAIRRSYNGGPLGSYHGGVDIAVDAGTPVPASNRGRVVLAELLHVRGNTVIIDHGMGVYTAYFHMSQIKVQKGQMVDKGQILGLSGTTGVSTGPHLHWEMRVTGMAVDPWPWTQRQFP
jgi:murein DD-endopeptidase MepM/ murein hydrolase activator NlpD